MMQVCGKDLQYGAGQLTGCKEQDVHNKQEDATTEQSIKPYIS